MQGVLGDGDEEHAGVPVVPDADRDGCAVVEDIPDVIQRRGGV